MLTPALALIGATLLGLAARALMRMGDGAPQVADQIIEDMTGDQL